MTFEYEYTDTFAGEANYCWVKRGTVSVPELTHYRYDGSHGYAKADARQSRHVMRKVKAELGLSGVRGRREDWGDCIAFYPYGHNTVLFIAYCDDCLSIHAARQSPRGIGGKSKHGMKGKPMDIESIAARLNEIGESRVDYETAHRDAGDNYAYLVAESWHSEQELRLVDYMREKGIDWTGIEIDAIVDSVLDQFTMEPGYAWSMGSGGCLLESFLVGEVEIQIDAGDLGVESVTDDLCETLSRQSDFYITRQDTKTILAYQATDCAWDACISETALRGIVAALRDSL